MNKGYQQNKESGVSIKQGVSAEQKGQKSPMNNEPQENKELGVSIKQGVSNKQRVRGLS